MANSFQDDLYVYPLHIVFAGLLNIAILKVLDLVLLVMLLLCMCWYGRKCIRLRIKYLLTIVLVFFFISAFLARLNNIHGELLFYPRRRHWRPQMLKFSLKFLKPHY